MSCGVKENYGNIYLMKEKIANKTNPLGHSKSRSTSAPLCPTIDSQVSHKLVQYRA